MEDKKTSLIYKILRFFVWLFSPRYEIVGKENIPGKNAVIVGNHCQIYGPIAGELDFPGKHYIWCAGSMMRWSDVHAYAFEDFWSFKPKWQHWFFKLVSYLITPVSVCVFNNAHTIPVDHDTRILTTFRSSIDRLKEGNNIIIFPEHNKKRNNIVYDFQDKFIDLARFYYRKTGEALEFVPMYLAPRIKKMIIGEAIRFDPDAPIDEERERIANYLMDSITALATELPLHTVIPYRNIRKRDYPKNKPLEVYSNETSTV